MSCFCVFDFCLLIYLILCYGGDTLAALNDMSCRATDYNGVRLQGGYALDQITTPSFLHCDIACLQNPGCMSSHFCTGNSTCTLNMETTNDTCLNTVIIDPDCTLTLYGDCKSKHCVKPSECTRTSLGKQNLTHCIKLGQSDCLHTGRDDILSFMPPTPDKYVTVNVSVPELTQFTMCFWMQVANSSVFDNSLTCVLSYAVPGSMNELYWCVTQSNMGINVGINGKHVVQSVSSPIADGNWHEICTSWSSIDGRLITYKDGEMIAGSTLAVGKSISSTNFSKDGPLGMEDGTIPNSGITSSYSHPHCSPHPPGDCARLNYQSSSYSNAWCGGSSNNWLQIDLGKPYFVTKTATQGRRNVGQFVTSFQLHLSQDGVNFECYKLSGSAACENLIGNSDHTTVVHQTLDRPVEATFVRFYPKSWTSHPSMRVEVYGYGYDCLILGQEQDNLCGGFSEAQNFEGNLTRINIWDTAFSNISDMAGCNGNIMGWDKRQEILNFHGGMQFN